jgi:hypothetical protein
MFKKDANGKITQLTTENYKMENIGGGGSGLYHGPKSTDLTWLWILLAVLALVICMCMYYRNK